MTESHQASRCYDIMAAPKGLAQRSHTLPNLINGRLNCLFSTMLYATKSRQARCSISSRLQPRTGPRRSLSTTACQSASTMIMQEGLGANID